ncbi:Tar (HIV-1) RNA binding protein 1 [Terramyces sp. JEL0728]|nr:Tar (HIV-1) RNA binding protein 1 [Terramyces sp. JEL0728]
MIDHQDITLVLKEIISRGIEKDILPLLEPIFDSFNNENDDIAAGNKEFRQPFTVMELLAPIFKHKLVLTKQNLKFISLLDKEKILELEPTKLIISFCYPQMMEYEGIIYAKVENDLFGLLRLCDLFTIDLWNDTTVSLIQKGLLDENEIKYALLLLKRLRPEMNDFFILFETIQEPYIHLIIPQLKLLEEIPHPWNIIILKKGLQNSSFPVRKRLVQHILSLDIQDKEFQKELLIYLDKPAFYQMLASNIECEFGDLVANYVCGLKDLKMVLSVLPLITTRIPVLFYLEGLKAYVTESTIELQIDENDLQNIYLLLKKDMHFFKHLNLKQILAEALLPILKLYKQYTALYLACIHLSGCLIEFPETEIQKIMKEFINAANPFESEKQGIEILSRYGVTTDRLNSPYEPKKYLLMKLSTNNQHLREFVRNEIQHSNDLEIIKECFGTVDKYQLEINVGNKYYPEYVGLHCLYYRLIHNPEIEIPKSILKLVGDKEFNITKYKVLEFMQLEYQEMIDLLDGSTSYTAGYLFRSIYKQSLTVEQLETILDIGIRIIDESWTTKDFPFLLETFTKIAFQKPELQKIMWDRYLKWGETRFGIVPLASKEMHGVNKDILVEMCLYGPTREQDILDQKHESLIALKQKLPFFSSDEISEIKDTAEWNFYNLDYTVRIRANTILNNTNDTMLIYSLLNKLENAKFINSKEHKRNLRIWQSVHLLFDSDFTDLDLLLKLMIKESIAQTRVFIEWIIARLVITNTQLYLPKIIELVRDGQRAHTIGSLFSILLMIFNATSEKIYVAEQIYTLYPWLTNNHFNIRVMAQYIISTVYNELKDGEEHIKTVVEYINHHNDIQKHLQKCRDYYFTSGFHALKDLNLEFLFNNVIEILELDNEERISCTAFIRMDPDGRVKSGYEGRLGKRVEASKSERLKQERTKKEHVEIETNILQKKIVPWEKITNLDFTQKQDNARRNPLVVVASLIEKAPNLGGLCRTLETFNAELLVMDNLNALKDPNFIASCVSADKWMPIKQVKTPDLTEYLLQLKQAGYSLIGVEQATHSVSLEKFKFPKKSVLVLGKEREGIPPALLVLMDYIVEIPQYGLIRSLNVHVSGSMIIWEYVKQQVIQK